MAFVPIVDSAKKSAYVRRQILSEIQQGTYGPGAKLPSQRELGRVMNVSRNSIREALSALEIAGVIRTEPGRGSHVASFPISQLSTLQLPHFLENTVDLLEIWEAKRYLEGVLVSMAIEKATASETRQLDAILAEMKVAVELRDYDSYLVSNVRLHLGIARMSGNSGLIQALIPLLKVSHQVSRLTKRTDKFSVSKHLDESLKVHSEIVTAIKGRAVGKATELLNQHFDELQQYLRHVLLGR